MESKSQALPTLCAVLLLESGARKATARTAEAYFLIAFEMQILSSRVMTSELSSFRIRSIESVTNRTKDPVQGTLEGTSGCDSNLFHLLTSRSIDLACGLSEPVNSNRTFRNYAFYRKIKQEAPCLPFLPPHIAQLRRCQETGLSEIFVFLEYRPEKLGQAQSLQKREDLLYRGVAPFSCRLMSLLCSTFPPPAYGVHEQRWNIDRLCGEM